MTKKMINKFLSRKYTVTMTGMLLGSFLAYADKLDGQSALLLSVGIGAYNWANTTVKNIERKNHESENKKNLNKKFYMV